MKKQLKKLAATVALLAGATASTNAVSFLILDDPAFGGFGDVVVPGVGGFAAYVGPVSPTWIINVSAGLSKPILGDAITPHMDLVSQNTSSAAGAIDIYWTDTDFGPSPAGTFTTAVGGTISGNAGSSGTFLSLLDLANAPLGGLPLAVLGPFGPGSFSGSAVTAHPALAGPYSLTLIGKIVHSAAGVSSFDLELTSVPDGGATAMLLGLGFIGLGALARRKV